jgi:hypothetical protein
MSRLFRVVVLGGAALGAGCGTTPQDTCAGVACPGYGQTSATSTSTAPWTGRSTSTAPASGTTVAATTGSSTGSTTSVATLPDGGVPFW